MKSDFARHTTGFARVLILSVITFATVLMLVYGIFALLNFAGHKGGATAQYYLGFFAEEVDKDLTVATGWYVRAAAQNHPKALSRLGDFYSHGIAFEKDKKMAFLLYQRAAMHGSDYARYRAGMALVEGDGVDRNIPNGLRYLERAANADYPSAQGYLATTYAIGRYVPQDLTLARRWAVLAKRNDAPDANVILEAIEDLQLNQRKKGE